MSFSSLTQALVHQNLVTKAPSANLPTMLVARLLPFVKNLYTRKWSDEDVIEDVQFLRDELETNFQSLTYALPRILTIHIFDIVISAEPMTNIVRN